MRCENICSMHVCIHVVLLSNKVKAGNTLDVYAAADLSVPYETLEFDWLLISMTFPIILLIPPAQ